MDKYIYVIELLSEGLHKFGYTNNPCAELKDVTLKWNPAKVRLAMVFCVPNATQALQSIQQQFDDCRVDGGEWFKFIPQDIEVLVTTLAKLAIKKAQWCEGQCGCVVCSHDQI